ncbi:hypothetical protein ACI6QG_11620, partial [Roseococcus sp. DSY-14]|uniref:hypothetical protein n=1 Tax=Roseococcus sp. DSY-14 TaxID=3369650 RepID=UPI00387B5B26
VAASRASAPLLAPGPRAACDALAAMLAAPSWRRPALARAAGFRHHAAAGEAWLSLWLALP